MPLQTRNPSARSGLAAALLALFLALVSGCGPAAPPADEVTESWTSGDDEPLEPSEPSRD